MKATSLIADMCWLHLLHWTKRELSKFVVKFKTENPEKIFCQTRYFAEFSKNAVQCNQNAACPIHFID